MKWSVQLILILLLSIPAQSDANIRAVLGFAGDPDVRVGQLPIFVPTTVYVIAVADSTHSMSQFSFSFVPGSAHLGEDLLVLSTDFAGVDLDPAEYDWHIQFDQCVTLTPGVPSVLATLNVVRLSNIYETTNEQFCIRADRDIFNVGPLVALDCAGGNVSIPLADWTSVSGSLTGAGPGCSITVPCCPPLPLESTRWTLLKTRY